jgi:hypothetical protein
MKSHIRLIYQQCIVSVIIFLMQYKIIHNVANLGGQHVVTIF